MEVIYEKKKEMTFIGYHTVIRPDEGYQKCPEFWEKEYAMKYAKLWQTMEPANAVEKAIIENGVGETVGLTDLTNFDAKNLRAEFGIVIASNHRRCGYARKALLEVLSYAKQVLHLHQLYAIIDSNNLAACKLFTDSGFNESTTLKDWLYDGSKYHHAHLFQIFL